MVVLSWRLRGQANDTTVGLVRGLIAPDDSGSKIRMSGAVVSVSCEGAPVNESIVITSVP